jgi:threonine/homoserine/homoserine lactone efflux protein
MIEPTTYGLFLLAVLTLFLSPGPNMAFVLSHGVAHGVRGGFAAAIGIAMADVIFTILTATGITALVAAWPPSFDILRYAGAIYLVWLAFNAIRHPGGIGTLERQNDSFTNIVRRAMVNDLLNPKALCCSTSCLARSVDRLARFSNAIRMPRNTKAGSWAWCCLRWRCACCSSSVQQFVDKEIPNVHDCVPLPSRRV